MSMYIRIKRQKTTIFLQVEPTDTVLEVKQKLQTLLDKPPEHLRLYKLPKEGEAETGPKTLLEDAQKLADAKVENEDRLALCYQLEDGAGWEEISITPVEADGAQQ